jgi:beta-lactamase superfamily II metal-dependent hydrolase
MAKAVLYSMHPLTRLHAGESWPLVSGVAGEILDPQADVIADSLIVRIQLGGIRVLMLPRLDPYTLARLAMIPDNSLKAEVIILPLGGSELSASLQVIRRIAPWLVISTVDGLNRNGLPSSEWKNLLADEGVILMRQDETGAVLLEADPQSPKAIPFLQPDYPVSLDGQTPVTGANPKKPLIE